jgi:hypothetical protein
VALPFIVGYGLVTANLYDTLRTIRNVGGSYKETGMNDKMHIHIVKSRESLTKIAEEYYGRKNGYQWKKIYAANKKVIGDDASLIQPGMELIIPSLGVNPLNVSLLYDVDRLPIWLNRLDNLRCSIGQNLVETSRQFEMKKMTDQAHLSNDEQDEDQHDLDLQEHQLMVLGLLAVYLESYLVNEVRSYVTSLLSPKWSSANQHKAPPTYLLRSLFDQASTDLEIIQKARHQRRLVRAGDEDVQTLSPMGRMLALADRLAQRGVQPVAKLIQPEIVTFFSTTMSIRQIPYLQDMILLSIPFASVSTNIIPLNSSDPLPVIIDLLAIPHELGHHIFLYLNQEPDEMSSQQTKYARWIEEIFADVYGCFIAGPLSALGLQVILADTRPQEWLQDNGHHPVPALRPFITTEILRQLSQHDAYPVTFEHAPDLLDKNWEAILRRQGIISADQTSFKDVAFTYQTNDKRPESIKIKRLRGELTEIIRFYIEKLITNFDKEHFKPWSEDKTSLDAYDQVLRDFVNEVSQDENPKLEDEDSIWKKSEDEHANLVNEIDQIRSILAKWGHKGPEGSHVD